jgi:hypothetical protein
MRSIEEFDWGWMGEDSSVYKIMLDGTHKPMTDYHKDAAIIEIFGLRVYERFFEVLPGDIVLDIGASIGIFTYSILHKNPKHVYCVEPSESEFKTLIRNTIGYPVTPILKGISTENSLVDHDMLFGGETEMEGITFKKLIDAYDLKKIDFLKIDCEGGEYLVFVEDNLEFLKSVPKIVGEWHLSTPELKNSFRHFRDNILINFPKYEVTSVDMVDIKWDLWNEHFIEYYTEVLIYIDNRVE